ncbi:unnamed protein product [Prorocentrum cordatum]|uniref:Uncharacterized protein n=1 Tax=Prorocentrum cordatum TaxID=2364126 RepID=A0ABN9PP62_9DINO|nr:unnamed protein product [Polarella glacialis]
MASSRRGERAGERAGPQGDCDALLERLRRLEAKVIANHADFIEHRSETERALEELARAQRDGETHQADVEARLSRTAKLARGVYDQQLELQADTDGRLLRLQEAITPPGGSAGGAPPAEPVHADTLRVLVDACGEAWLERASTEVAGALQEARRELREELDARLPAQSEACQGRNGVLSDAVAAELRQASILLEREARLLLEHVREVAESHHARVRDEAVDTIESTVLEALADAREQIQHQAAAQRCQSESAVEAATAGATARFDALFGSRLEALEAAAKGCDRVHIMDTTPPDAATSAHAVVEAALEAAAQECDRATGRTLGGCDAAAGGHGAVQRELLDELRACAAEQRGRIQDAEGEAIASVREAQRLASQRLDGSGAEAARLLSEEAAAWGAATREEAAAARRGAEASARLEGESATALEGAARSAAEAARWGASARRDAAALREAEAAASAPPPGERAAGASGEELAELREAIGAVRGEVSAGISQLTAASEQGITVASRIWEQCAGLRGEAAEDASRHAEALAALARDAERALGEKVHDSCERISDHVRAELAGEQVAGQLATEASAAMRRARDSFGAELQDELKRRLVAASAALASLLDERMESGGAAMSTMADAAVGEARSRLLEEAAGLERREVTAGISELAASSAQLCAGLRGEAAEDASRHAEALAALARDAERALGEKVHGSCERISDHVRAELAGEQVAGQLASAASAAMRRARDSFGAELQDELKGRLVAASAALASLLEEKMESGGAAMSTMADAAVGEARSRLLEELDEFWSRLEAEPGFGSRAWQLPGHGQPGYAGAAAALPAEEHTRQLVAEELRARATQARAVGEAMARHALDDATREELRAGLAAVGLEQTSNVPAAGQAVLERVAQARWLLLHLRSEMARELATGETRGLIQQEARDAALACADHQMSALRQQVAEALADHEARVRREVAAYGAEDGRELRAEEARVAEAVRRVAEAVRRVAGEATEARASVAAQQAEALQERIAGLARDDALRSDLAELRAASDARLCTLRAELAELDRRLSCEAVRLEEAAAAGAERAMEGVAQSVAQQLHATEARVLQGLPASRHGGANSAPRSFLQAQLHAAAGQVRQDGAGAGGQ